MLEGREGKGMGDEGERSTVLQVSDAELRDDGAQTHWQGWTRETKVPGARCKVQGLGKLTRANSLESPPLSLAAMAAMDIWHAKPEG
jgi:hypothetical protein